MPCFLLCKVLQYNYEALISIIFQLTAQKSRMVLFETCYLVVGYVAFVNLYVEFDGF